MMRKLILNFSFCFIVLVLLSANFSFSQETVVTGKILDAKSKDPINFAEIRFDSTAIVAYSLEDGTFQIICPYKSDTLTITNLGYQTQRIAINVFEKQDLKILMKREQALLDEVVIKSQGDPPAIKILKKVIENKPINDKEKLSAYHYKVYTRTQIDLSNLTDKFKDRSFVKKLDFVTDYLDSAENGKKFLPVMLSETVSDLYYRKSPQKTREIVHATKMAGIEDFDLNHLFGDVFLDINFYDNYVDMFQRSFLSPISKYARGIYDYLLIDSAYIDNQFCYLLSFKPKRVEGTTFEGEMWIHDTTFALKEINATLSSVANINFLHGVKIHQFFEQIQHDVWMMKDERLFLDLSATKQGKIISFHTTKTSNRSEFEINNILPDNFYNEGKTVELTDGAKKRSLDYWDSIRPQELTNKEQGIYQMVDSMNASPFWQNLYHTLQFFGSGYFPVSYVEIGDLYNLFRFNPVEKFGMTVSLRTSNKFSKTVELGGFVGYAILNKKINWGAKVRVRVNPKGKFGIMSFYGSSQIAQYGQSADIGSLFGSLLRVGIQDKLFYEDKVGYEYEQDLGKDFNMIFAARSIFLNSVGLAKFERYDAKGQLYDAGRIATTELSLNFSWTKERQFATAVYERKYMGSKFPMLYVEGLFGFKGLFGSEFNYQKAELGLKHIVGIGALGRLKYGFSAGKYFGKVPYPFLNLHDGGQTIWFSRVGFNKLGYFELISDAYVTGYFEHHFQGLILNRIPLIKKLKWRLVIHARTAWGTLNNYQNDALVIPSFTSRFDKMPYVETGIGIENIFKFFRVDFVYRATHHIPGVSPFGVRFRLEVHI